jgi:predicted RNA methylase
MAKIRTQMTAALASAALVLAVILTIAPHASIIMNEASSEILGIDIFGITADAKGLSAQQYAAQISNPPSGSGSRR